jgi:hypothetical protein
VRHSVQDGTRAPLVMTLLVGAVTEFAFTPIGSIDTRGPFFYPDRLLKINNSTLEPALAGDNSPERFGESDRVALRPFLPVSVHTDALSHGRRRSRILMLQSRTSQGRVVCSVFRLHAVCVVGAAIISNGFRRAGTNQVPFRQAQFRGPAAPIVQIVITRDLRPCAGLAVLRLPLSGDYTIDAQPELRRRLGLHRGRTDGQLHSGEPTIRGAV